MNVKELVQECLQGETGAWKMLVDCYSKRIFNLAYQFAGSRQEAEDLTQEIFLKLFRSLSKYDFERDFTAWFLTLSRNYLIDEFRKRKAEKSQRFDGEASSLPAVEKDNPEIRYLDEEKAEMVRLGLQQLPPELRMVLVLREIEGFSYEEIAREIKVPLGTVKSRVNRARIHLARIILDKTGGKI
ncbi:MAG TPA: RNA polymerase sigma factor [Candidatus Saccharicenans sp.]|nr:RNA polymerase sigma factor [Candidatus Saccharicenans sp.]HRD01257.1 RNA polymerase sigma factor [Candidatus Saccharicenans sp.]